MKKNKNKKPHLFAAGIGAFLSALVCITLIAGQFTLYAFMIVGYNLWYVLLPAIFVSVLFALTLYRRNVNSTYKLSWTVIILSMPPSGALLYLIFGLKKGRRGLKKRTASEIRIETEETEKVKEFIKSDATAARLIDSVKNGSPFIAYGGTNVEFFPSIAQKQKRLLADIAAAKRYIYMEYFIFADSLVLNEIADALEQKCAQGVAVKLIYDTVGSMGRLSRKMRKRLESIEGLTLCAFEPMGVMPGKRLNYRDHRKVVVIDGCVGYLGGDNLADEYTGRLVKFGRWRDCAARLEGAAVNALEVMFAQNWLLATGERLSVGLPEICGDGVGIVMPFADGADRLGNPTYALFQTMTAAANKYLYLSTPYFVIDNAFVNILKVAARSGVDVRVLTPHIPDKKAVFTMTRGHYGDLLRAGVKVYEFSPGFNHTKTLIADDRFAYLGSANCDYRSMFLNFESGALLIDNPEIIKMRDDFLSSLEQSEEITLEQWKRRPLIHKLAESLLSILAPLV